MSEQDYDPGLRYKSSSGAFWKKSVPFILKSSKEKGGDRLNSQKGLGLALLVLGILVFLGFIGVHLGELVLLALSALFFYLGFRGWRKGHKVLGFMSLVVGVLMFLSALPFLAVTVLAVGLMFWGYRLIKKGDAQPSGGPGWDPAPEAPQGWEGLPKTSTFDEQWSRFMRNKSFSMEGDAHAKKDW